DRRYTKFLAVVGLVALFVLAAIMNMSISRSDKADLLWGATAGMLAGTAISVTSREWLNRPRR
ncbi:MAG: hypothetical protein MUE55_04955, partial [Thermoplasmata archaeon]|nr:hypothetical protein [Thermoplasmata archaeon]